MGTPKRPVACGAEKRSRATRQGRPRHAQWNDLLAEHQGAMAGLSRAVRSQSVYTRFQRWTKAGVWEWVLSALMEQDIVDETALILDSTTIKVHQHDSGVKKGVRRSDGAKPLRIDDESPCSNGWTWESVAFSALRRKP